MNYCSLKRILAKCLYLVLVVALAAFLNAPTDHSLGKSPAAASLTVTLLPVTDGYVRDDSPFDGYGDAIEETQGIAVYLTPGIAAAHGVIEFDFRSFDPNTIFESAVLQIDDIGGATCSGGSAVPIELYGFAGDGSLQPSDFHIGTSIGVFNVTSGPELLDVTYFLQNESPLNFVGFSLRTGVCGQVNFGSLEFSPPPTLILKLVVYVNIDIKPGGSPNSINLKSRGVVPVAVLTSPPFDASDVNPGTVLFAGASPVNWNWEDVDFDGDLDLLFHFNTQDLNLTLASTSAELTGNTSEGIPITGMDRVNIVPK